MTDGPPAAHARQEPKNWVIRLADAVERFDKRWKRFADSFTGRWLLERRRRRKLRKADKSR